MDISALKGRSNMLREASHLAEKRVECEDQTGLDTSSHLVDPEIVESHPGRPVLYLGRLHIFPEAGIAEVGKSRPSGICQPSAPAREPRSWMRSGLTSSMGLQRPSPCRQT